mgnify:CR=1 FL=1
MDIDIQITDKCLSYLQNIKSISLCYYYTITDEGLHYLKKCTYNWVGGL